MTELLPDHSHIAPTLQYISNEIVLIQAWKKTQKYIRRHNWYADELEIDCSTINLEKNAKQWSVQLKNKTYQPQKTRVVPAPKNGRWVFRENNEETHQPFSAWGSEEEIKLRPLAHLSIDDQTVATAALLCLADAIETAQGPSDEEDFFKAQKNKIYSYGNRLQCEWNVLHDLRKQATFNWGNSQLYRKYYEDYRLFLKRSKKICQYNAPKLLPNQNLFIVSVDLKGFFDHIDRGALINQLRKIYDEYVKEYKLSGTHETEDSFWDVLEDIFSWEWDASEEEIELFDTPLPMGLPQGMVASGFLSNAYLIDFDKSIGESINNNILSNSTENSETIIENRQIVLRDYCRYVDDLRLVIEASDISDTDSNFIAECVTEFIENKLEDHMMKISAENKLIINPDKTKVTSFRQTSIESNVSSMMSLFQGVFSGTPDVESLREVVGGLDGLLHFSEDLLKENEKRTNHLELSYISKPNIDVRDDTLKRFAGVRIANSLKMRRGMTDLSDSVNNNENFFDSVTEGEIIDHEFETSARKLISCWATNPSLTLLLKCGLDLFPDKILLNSILEALDYILFPDEQPDVAQKESVKQIRVIEYVTADLFRCGAVDIGYKSELEYPASANVSSFRQELCTFAKKIIDERKESPWYLKQQALLFLTSVGETVNFEEKEEGIANYEYLQKLSSYQIMELKDIGEWFPISLVIQQLHPNKDKFSHWFVRLMNKTRKPELQRELIHLVVLNNAKLLENIGELRLAKNKEWINYIPDFIQKTSQKDYDLTNNEDFSLLRVIQNYNNPFTQENALLLLIYHLLNIKNVEEKLAQNNSLKSIRVRSTNWTKIQSLKDNLLTVEFIESNKHNTIDGLYEPPPWVTKKKVWLYKLGSILRSCLTSEFDFTTSTFLSREEELGRYFGVRSTWYSRRFGLTNSPSGLSKYQDPITPWLSELLFLLLQWPGIHVHEEYIHKFEEISTPGELLKIIVKRIEHQRRLYGKITDTPVYELSNVCYNKSDDSTFRVVMVQTLLPKTKDFIVQDPTHWTASLRAKHKAHLASVCRLIRLKLKSWAKAQNSKNDTMVDLIVFPELSVHPDDVWILRRLSDSTKASIFAGMTFIQHELRDVPVNQALWILRSQKHSGRNFVEVRQGKHHMTTMENKMGVTGHRPYQVLVEFQKKQGVSIRVTGAICYDATDLSLVADLRDISDMFVVTALNKDINTFDNMVNALHYHMYQPVILANTGEFGGSTAQAPYTKHDRLIAHVHGQNQIAISVFELDPTVFKSNTLPDKPMDIKTAPAGYPGRQ